MKHYKVTLTCNTPVFVGSGEKLKKIEYLLKDGKVYFLKESAWAQLLYREKLTARFAEAFLRENLKWYTLDDFLKKNRHLTFDTLRDEGALGEGIPAELPPQEIKSLNDICLFMRDAQGRRYIPGSTIKGAMRTAILAQALGSDGSKWLGEFERDIDGRNYRGSKGKAGRIADRMERELAIPLNAKGKREMVDSFFRGLSVSDAYLEDESAVIVKKYDLGIKAAAEGREPAGISIYRECLAPGTRAVFSLDIDETSMGELGVTDWDDLFGVLIGFMGLQERLLNSAFSSQKAMLKEIGGADIILGGGTGFINKTLIYALGSQQESVNIAKWILADQFDRPNRKGDHKHREDELLSPHTMKLTKYNGHYCPMGLMSIEAEEIC